MSMDFISIAKGTYARYVRPAHLRAIHTAVERIVRQRIHGTVTVVCVDDRTMQALNRRYRGKNRTTDVLSFLYSERQTPRSQSIVGEILLATPEVRRQARERKRALHIVIDELVVHGFLHLLGYDHERSKKAARIMFGLQEKILQYVFRHTTYS